VRASFPCLLSHRDVLLFLYVIFIESELCDNWFSPIRLKEGKQLSMVLNHPAFQADPLGSIHQHLLSTQPVAEEKPKKKMNKNGGKKVKGKKSKSLTTPQSMDF